MSEILIQPVTAHETLLLRHSVLWPEKSIDYVRLPDDEQGLHLGGFVDGQLVSVISLFIDDATATARFRKFATHPAYQNRGIGTLLLRKVIEEARKAGANQLWCDARLSAAPFYERFGMQADGALFYKGEISYSRFVLLLA